ncbi:hypothetical protein UFOVP1304_51 [uncultured Caudovirales phage]|uniref:Uncharacterized protein n=1 Tax=uncultured Caudovirales phage TaxID=2100421 RepID=A0A6J5RSB0_9CAUD|nr:hypothetical protein UFOVP1304_51 [uncultured Caudovirales phage]
MKRFDEMTLQEISDWVVANNIDPDGNCIFDELPQIEDLSDEEADATFDEYESMADEIAFIIIESILHRKDCSARRDGYAAHCDCK